MANDSNGKLSKLITDSTIVLTALTGLAYFSGYAQTIYFWHRMGVYASIEPETTFYGTMVTGSMVVLLALTILFGLYTLYEFLRLFCPKSIVVFFSKIKSHQIFERKTYLNALKLIYSVTFLILFCVILAIQFAKNSARDYKIEYKQLKTLTTTSGAMIDNPEELTYLGHLNSGELFKRTIGINTGEFVLVKDTDIQAMTLK